VVVAEHDDAVVAQRVHEPQRLQRLAAPVDQVAAEPQRVARRVEADALQQPLRRRVTSRQVADRPACHDASGRGNRGCGGTPPRAQCASGSGRLASRTKPSTGTCSPRISGRRPAASISAGVATAASALRSVLRRWPKAARTMAAKREGSLMPTVPGARGTSRTTAESTFGAGRNAPGPTVNSGVTVQYACSITLRRP